MRHLFIFLTIITVLSACKDDAEPTTNNTYTPLAQRIIGTWVLSSTTHNNSKSSSTYPATIDPLTIEFKSDSRLSFAGPCNLGGALSYLLSESGGLQINDLIKTNKACGSTQEDWETRGFNGLQNAYHANISGNTLEILTDGTYSLTFTKQ